MDVSKVNLGLDMLGEVNQQHLALESQKAQILRDVADILGEVEDPSFVGQPYDTPIRNAPAQLTMGENHSQNQLCSPILPLLRQQMFAKGQFTFSSMKNTYSVTSSAARSLAMPDSGFKLTYGSPLMLRDDSLAQTPPGDVSEFMAPPIEENYEEIDLSVPPYCREARQQNEEQEREYAEYAQMWRSEEEYRDYAYEANGDVVSGGFSGSVAVSISVEVFERRFPGVRGHSLLDQTGQLITQVRKPAPASTQEELLELNVPAYLTKNRTAFPDTDYMIGETIRSYKIFSMAGEGTFSKTYACEHLGKDSTLPPRVCVKMVKCQVNDAFQQALSEIVLLRELQATNSNRIVRLLDFFYLNSGLFLVEELLHDNLYEVMETFKGTSCRYFDETNIRLVATQVLEALLSVHDRGIIHCDIKPENILMKRPTHAKTSPDCVLIDFGSARYKQEFCGESYIQSRPYRCPEVILGCTFDEKADIWSMGCVLAELFRSSLLFENLSAATLLAQIIGTCGPIPEWMLEKGTEAQSFFRQNQLYEVVAISTDPNYPDEVTHMVQLHFPKPTTLKDRLDADDDLFVDFMSQLLQIDPNKRPTAAEALKHEFLRQ